MESEEWKVREGREGKVTTWLLTDGSSQACVCLCLCFCLCLCLSVWGQQYHPLSFRAHEKTGNGYGEYDDEDEQGQHGRSLTVCRGPELPSGDAQDDRLGGVGDK